MEAGKDWLEVILKRKSYESSPVKVIEFESSGNVMGKGENYLSEIVRIKAKVLLGSGRVKRISLIVKNQHETGAVKQLCVEIGAFFREITMYRDILPKMEVLLEEAGNAGEVFWGKCYDIRLYDRLIFEDLGERGYKMANRKKQLGLDAALLVMEHLAKFHALTRVLIDRGEIPVDIFGRHNFAKSLTNYNEMMDKCVNRTIDALEKWGDEWKSAAERFRKGKTNFIEKLLDTLIYDPNSNQFPVLCHADCWTNNMLFRGDDLEHPESMKLLDFQICFVSSPTFDVHVFTASSVRIDVLEKHGDELIEVYHSKLSRYLTDFGYTGSVPSLEEFKLMLDSHEVTRLGWNIILVPFVAGDGEDFPDYEEIQREIAEAKKNGVEPRMFNPLENANSTVISILKYCVKKCMQANVF